MKTPETNPRSQAATTVAQTPSTPARQQLADNTVVATATAPGAGGIAIVRMSGPESTSILKSAFVPANPNRAFEPRRMMYGKVTAADGSTIDETMAVLMPGPYSYTREDVAEIQCHGGEIAAKRVINRLISLGARAAEPGEFTKRAFLNGRIDLAKAEAVMQLIGANSEAAARASVRQLEGGVSGFVRDTVENILKILALIEASTDFPDEVEEEAAADQTASDITAIIREIDRRCDPRAARLMREGASIVLCGRPNVGKSSLMNALLNQERAIVTAIPGTTRDVLTERILIGGVAAEISDTAGCRDTDDPVEKIGVDRARRAIEQADILLIVLDSSMTLTDEDRDLLALADARTIVCLNKSDLETRLTIADLALSPDVPALTLSADSGDGLPTLLTELESRLSRHVSDDKLTVERHIRRAQDCRAHLDAALSTIRAGLPLDTAAIDLHAALSSLSEITTQNPTESLLDEIFSTFCVGK